ncbi:hypothetical protein ACWA1F_02570 [Flavobacterium sp. 3-218]
MNEAEINEEQLSTSKCANCGAELKYKPGTNTLVCEYCGTKNEIRTENTIIEKLDFYEYLKKSESEDFETEKIIQCKSCGSISSVAENLKSLFCPYCGTALLENDIRDERFIKPNYIVPFNLDTPQVYNILSKWIDGLWWAPDNLKKTALSHRGLKGVYIPYWTFDLQTFSEYTGERGKNYTSTVKVGRNKIPIIETEWSDVSGSISVAFEDILTPASGNIDKNSLKQLFPWDMGALVKMNDKYLAGFVTEKYKVKLNEGFQNVQNTINSTIKTEICRKIGGDNQRINNLKTASSNIKFTHILLPVYVSTYTYNNKLYCFYVNGRSGKLVGERPYSNLKIALAILVAIIILAIAIVL